MKARVLVGRNIRRLRVECGLSQEALGHAAGCEPSYVGRIERGGENVGVDLLEALATALDVEVAAFFTESGGGLLPGLQPGRKPKVSAPPANLAPVDEATGQRRSRRLKPPS